MELQSKADVLTGGVFMIRQVSKFEWSLKNFLSHKILQFFILFTKDVFVLI